MKKIRRLLSTILVSIIMLTNVLNTNANTKNFDVSLLNAVEVAENIFHLEDSRYVMKKNNDTFITLDKITVTSLEDVVAKQLEERIQPETYKTLVDMLSNKNDKGSLEISVFTPEVSDKAQIASGYISSRTYQGYGNRTYYEEVLVSDMTTGWKNINTTQQWVVYRDAVISAGMEFLVGLAMDYVTLGSWSVINIFTSGTSGISGSTVAVHQANLFESKYMRFTYLVESDGYWFGSRTENSNSYFKNDLSIPGASGYTISGKNTSLSNARTPNYNTGYDKMAYFSYLSGGHTETIEGFLYRNTWFNSVGN